MALSFAICLENSGLDDLSGEDLEVGRVYEVLGEEQGWLRVVDASGEDYLYPEDWFEHIHLSEHGVACLDRAFHS